MAIHPTDRPTNERGEERENRCHKRPVKISRQMGPPLTPSLGCENVVVVALHACLRKREDGRTIAVNHSFKPQHIAERRREGGPHAADLTCPASVCRKLGTEGDARTREGRQARRRPRPAEWIGDKNEIQLRSVRPAPAPAPVVMVVIGLDGRTRTAVL